jgi:hypothetical protein
MSALTTLLLMLALLGAPAQVGADEAAGNPGVSPGAARDPAFLLAPPPQDGPVVVRADFELRDINEIDALTETFSFTGVLSLEWNDPRLAFDPAPGADEKVYQGNYQFNELAAGWYPQVVLLNESGAVQQSGVVLRIGPDGSSTLTQTITATAETGLDMRWFPFDAHRLEAVFVVLGFDRDEVRLEAKAQRPGSFLSSRVQIPQWAVRGSDMSVQDRSAANPGRPGASAAFVVGVEVEREALYIRRLVTFPLAVIVLLSFSVFWMDRSSLGDRISVSFIGILTGVTYQLVMWDVLPHISYFTLMHGFLMHSFVIMCSTVVINLVVGSMDKAGRYELGDRIDQRCRWIFPLVYFAGILLLYLFARAFY